MVGKNKNEGWRRVRSKEDQQRKTLAKKLVKVKQQQQASNHHRKMQGHEHLGDAVDEEGGGVTCSSQFSYNLNAIDDPRFPLPEEEKQLHPWWWYWRSRNPRQEKVSTVEQIALTKATADSLVALLQHQSTLIVALGLSFWRVLMIRLENVDETPHARCLLVSCYPPLHGADLLRLRHPHHTMRDCEGRQQQQQPWSHCYLGVMGYLSKLVLPPVYMREKRRVLSYPAIKDCTSRENKKKSSEEESKEEEETGTTPFCDFLNFFYWALHAEQVDVVATILDTWEFNLNDHYDEFGEYRWDWVPPFGVLADNGSCRILMKLFVGKYNVSPYNTGEYDSATYLHTTVGSTRPHRLETLRTLLEEPISMQVDTIPVDTFELGGFVHTSLHHLMSQSELTVRIYKPSTDDVLNGLYRKPSAAKRRYHRQAVERIISRTQSDRFATDKQVMKLLLLDHGARTDIWDAEGLAPLHAGVKKNNTRLVEQLLRLMLLRRNTVSTTMESGDGCQRGGFAGDDINLLTKCLDQKSSLHIAAENRSIEMVRVLLAASSSSPALTINVNIKDRSGKTPLDYLPLISSTKKKERRRQRGGGGRPDPSSAGRAEELSELLASHGAERSKKE